MRYRKEKRMIKTFTHWINEAKSLKPSTLEQLKALVKEEIAKQGPQADLNHIDVSNVTDMNGMFAESQFNGDISAWDVSNVKKMGGMFRDSQFNGDISAWDVSNVKNMRWMFAGSQFQGDISKWNVSNVERMGWMFQNSQFNGDISKWNVSNVKNMSGMFYNSQFSGEISAWDVSNVTDMNSMFQNSQFNGEISKWAIPLEKKVQLYSLMSSFKAYTTEELEDLIQLAMRQKQPLDATTVKALAASRAFQTLKTSKKFGL
jgi:surface protein